MRASLFALALSAPALASAPRVVLVNEFKPNPLVVTLHRSEGGSLPLGALTACKNAPPDARISGAPAAVLEIRDEFPHLRLLVSGTDLLIARSADGTKRCGDKVFELPAAKGRVELFVVTQGQVPKNDEETIRVFDADRPRYLPEPVKTLRFEPSAPLVLRGELSPGSTLPDAQIDVATGLEGITWKAFGAAAEVVVSSLSGADFDPPMKPGPALAAGRWALWVHGSSEGQSGRFAVAAVPGDVRMEPLQFVWRPLPDSPVEQRVLLSYMPALVPAALLGNAKSAQALRQRAFTELPAPFFVYAASDDEALLPLAVSDGMLSLVGADGRSLTLAPTELLTRPATGTAHAGRGERLGIAELAKDADPRVVALRKQRRWTQACLGHSGDAKRCGAAKLASTEGKLLSELHKAYATSHAAAAAAIEQHLKEILPGPPQPPTAAAPPGH
jgi:hypothetical protein